MTDFRARLQQAWTEGRGQPPTWVEEMLLDHYAEHMDAAMDRYFGNVVDWEPLGFLDNPAPWLKVELDRLGVSPLRAALAHAQTHSTPPDALRGTSSWGASSPTPPSWTAAVEERVIRELVPLVRAAAAEVPMGDVSGLRVDPNLARFRCFMPAERMHAAELPCWCGGFTTALGNVHLDERIPRGSNDFAFSSSELPRGWFS